MILRHSLSQPVCSQDILNEIRISPSDTRPKTAPFSRKMAWHKAEVTILPCGYKPCTNYRQHGGTSFLSTDSILSLISLEYKLKKPLKMVTGIEAISLTLAILPLMLNQLDDYIQGLQTLKLFWTRRYRKHLESCAAILGDQHAILSNTIGLALGDVSTVEFRDLISSPDGRPWRESHTGRYFAH